jgi:glycosyltransferase involved in cell wall biosynthesis
MRLLIVSDHYPPFIGGVQRQTRAMARELHARGYDVGVATVYQDDLPAFEEPDGFPLWRLRQLRSAPLVHGPARRRHQPPYPDPVTVFGLRRVIRSFRPDAVHSSGWFSYSAAAALIGVRIPLLVSAREYGFSCANASMLHRGSPCSGPALGKCLACSRWYFGTTRGAVAAVGVRVSARLLRHKVAAMHSVSNHVREVVERDVLRARERARVPHAVIPSFRIPADGEPDAAILKQLPDEPFMMFAGALRRVKGVETLLAAYRLLESPPPLVLLGTFESDTPSEFPPGVIAPGGASYATVLAAWDRSLFGVMPSLWPEPFGSVVHEAMSRGRPVIGTTPGGHTDMVEHERTGLLVSPADVPALRAAMQRLIDEPELREELGRRAMGRAADFTAETVIPQFEAFYAPFDPAARGNPPVAALSVRSQVSLR